MTEQPSNENETRIIKTDNEMPLDDIQVSEQLYSAAGLGPVVEAGLRDHDTTIKTENKFINKVFGPRSEDIKGYGEAVAKRVAYAVYAQLNRQYGGKVGDLREYIMTIEDERNRANARYDELMGRVIGILGEEYKNLRSDSNEFMKKLNDTLGEDIKASKIDQKALAESLADIDGMRRMVAEQEKANQELKEKYSTDTEALKEKYRADTEALKEKAAADSKALKEKAAADIKALEEKHQGIVKGIEEKHAATVKELETRYENQVTGLKQEHGDAVKELKAEAKEQNTARMDEIKGLNKHIAELENMVKTMEKEAAALNGELKELRANHAALKSAASELAVTVPAGDIGGEIGDAMFTYVLEDSKVPDSVIKGVGQFIDFRKYLKMAASQGAGNAVEKSREILGKLE